MSTRLSAPRVPCPGTRSWSRPDERTRACPSTRRQERDGLIEILGFCDLLIEPGYPGYTRAFVPMMQRAEVSDGDMRYPAERWRSGNGLNRQAAADWFGGCPEVRIPN